MKKKIELSEQNEQITLSYSSVKTHKVFLKKDWTNGTERTKESNLFKWTFIESGEKGLNYVNKMYK